jgi:hypothetical protein
MTSDEIYLMKELASDKCTTHYRDRKYQAMMLRSAKTPQDRDIIMCIIMDARERYRNWVTVVQREWQSKISRRPQRTKHHDSWALRESYVRGGKWTDYLPTPGSPERVRFG